MYGSAWNTPPNGSPPPDLATKGFRDGLSVFQNNKQVLSTNLYLVESSIGQF
jgi:hypothetical protein